ncbi:DeoR/GlpR family DNA-binding transcription regulator [uncultured Cohaesibacter sp.]|uniref:DeoR/GlpR family DNA-binding transcription regulator n=1 Tax=uncultured Cohaesibacter sp. TaxID=1002546 RepID=UPI0029C64EBE|nr:DeoR/GlpR family DNA-binding transcription regulator [uncultured Cohaesibacter sp.]
MKSDKKPLLGEQRRQKMLDLLMEEGSARVAKLSEMFHVSEPTIRQDLEKLEAEGHIIREHGGAFSKSMSKQVQQLALHHLENLDKKEAIGRKAAELVEDGDTIILDAGSTTTMLANQLTEKRRLRVMTNALNIVFILGREPSNSVLVTGGEFKAPTLSLSGEKAGAFFENMFAPKLFLAVGGVSFDAGLTYPGFNDLHVKSAMVKSAAHVYLLADSTKLGQVSFASLGGVELVNTIIIDAGISKADKKRFEELGIEVIIAD